MLDTHVQCMCSLLSLLDDLSSSVFDKSSLPVSSPLTKEGLRVRKVMWLISHPRPSSRLCRWRWSLSLTQRSMSPSANSCPQVIVALDIMSFHCLELRGLTENRLSQTHLLSHPHHKPHHPHNPHTLQPPPHQHRPLPTLPSLRPRPLQCRLFRSMTRARRARRKVVRESLRPTCSHCTRRSPVATSS